jgi:hypothetical protein
VNQRVCILVTVDPGARRWPVLVHEVLSYPVPITIRWDSWLELWLVGFGFNEFADRPWVKVPTQNNQDLDN